MFDELHDPDPPTPGLHEFAAVAERAQQIRRRRNTWMVRAASLVVLGGVAFAWSQMSDRTAVAPSSPATSAPATTTASTVVPLPEAIGSTMLPALALGPGTLTVNRDPIVELFEDDGRPGLYADRQRGRSPTAAHRRGQGSTRRRGRVVR